MILPTGAVTLFFCAIIGSLSMAVFCQSKMIKVLGIAACSLPLVALGIACLVGGV